MIVIDLPLPEGVNRLQYGWNESHVVMGGRPVLRYPAEIDLGEHAYLYSQVVVPFVKRAAGIGDGQ